jgi:UDP-glucose 4-epimerase
MPRPVPRVVAVTGVGDYPGNRLAARLAADPEIDRVIGIDTVAPTDADLLALGRTEFVAADSRNPMLARVLDSARVDTVVHAALTVAPGGRTPSKELNVLGTMQLLAACQNSESVRRLIVKSSTAVYGTSGRDPAIFTESMTAQATGAGGFGSFAKDCAEIEGYVRGYGRRRPDVTVTVFRFASFIGPTVSSALTRYLLLPVVPTPLGFDPRLQLIHEDDAVEILRRACVVDRPGTYNAAGDGVLLLSQAIRRAGGVALPTMARGLIAAAVCRVSSTDFSSDQLRLLNFGRVVDTRALHEEFGYQPEYSTEAAYSSFLAARDAGPNDRAEALLDRLARSLRSVERVVRHV